MTRLIIVRHGQTEWNTLHKMQGQQDSPLTATGRELARRLGVLGYRIARTIFGLLTLIEVVMVAAEAALGAAIHL